MKHHTQINKWLILGIILLSCVFISGCITSDAEEQTGNNPIPNNPTPTGPIHISLDDESRPEGDDTPFLELPEYVDAGTIICGKPVQTALLVEFGSPKTDKDKIDEWANAANSLTPNYRTNIEYYYYTWASETRFTWSPPVYEQPVAGHYVVDNFYQIDSDGWLNLYVMDRYTKPVMMYDDAGKVRGVGTPICIPNTVPTQKEAETLYKNIKESAEKFGITDIPVKIIKVKF